VVARAWIAEQCLRAMLHEQERGDDAQDTEQGLRPARPDSTSFGDDFTPS